MKPIIDAHLDLAWNALHWDRDLTQPLDVVRRAEAHMTDHPSRGRATVTLPEMRKAGIRLCLATILVRVQPAAASNGPSRRDLDYPNATIASAVAHGHLAYYQLLERQGHIRILRRACELRYHWQTHFEQPIGVILALEGADPIITPAEAGDWFKLGVRSVGLAHYGQGTYAAGTGLAGPLTPAGRQLLREFEQLGMIVDLTHCSEPGFFEALAEFSGPVHASHNMCRSLVPGDRQFSDEQLRRLIARDAVIGMALDAWMLVPGWVRGKTDRSVVSLGAVADHIDHICQLAGSARHVGIGSDLDGGFGTEQCPHDLDSIADLQKLAGILNARGYSDSDIDGIFHGNWLRFLTRALPA